MRLAKVCRCILSLDLDNHSVHVMTFTMTVSKLFEKSLELVMEFCSSVIRRVALLSLPSSGNVFSIWANEPKIHNHARNRNRFELITSARSMRRFNHETKKTRKSSFPSVSHRMRSVGLLGCNKCPSFLKWHNFMVLVLFFSNSVHESHFSEIQRVYNGQTGQRTDATS